MWIITLTCFSTILNNYLTSAADGKQHKIIPVSQLDTYIMKSHSQSPHDYFLIWVGFFKL
jgi:hypothetical protein